MFKLHTFLTPPFNKFAVFLLYGLLSLALITLAQEDGKETTISNGNGNKNDTCIVPLPIAETNIQVTIGYVQLFRINQQSLQPKIPESPIPKVQWSNYDFINVIAYPQDEGGDWYSIFRPKDKNKLKIINNLFEEVKQSAKILLSIRNYNVEQWPQDDDVDYQKIIDESITTIKEYHLDGIDIEYPGMRGFLCKDSNPSPNPPNPNGLIWDKRNDENFFNFLKNIRIALNEMEGGVKTLMLTVGRDVIVNLKDVMNNINFLNIETYHNSLYQNLKTPDNVNYISYPNSPLDLYKRTYEDWNNIDGIDSKKIIMGVDFGNTIQMVSRKEIEQTQTVLTPKSVIFDVKKLGLDDQTQPIRNFCPEEADSKLYSWPWRDLSNSILNPSGGFCSINTNIQSNLNWTRKFVETDISATPWLYSVVDTKFNFYLYVSYEDFVSLHSKLEFAMTNSIGGMSISDVSYDDINNSLLNFMQPIRGKAVPPAGGSSSSNEGNGKSNSNPNDSAKQKKKAGGIIAGSVIGSIIGLLLLGSCAYWYRQKTLLKSEAGDIKPKGAHMTTSKSEMASEQSPNRFGSPTVLPVASGHVTAMFDFIGKEENDLSFKKGDIIEVLEKGDGPNDWWIGRVHGVVGEFPGNYVKES